MAQKVRNVGEIESGGDATSATDTTGATMWYTAAVANFGAKAAAGGSVDVKFWTMVAGVRTLFLTAVGTAVTLAGALTVTGAVVFSSTLRTVGAMFIGDTANASNAAGLTVNQLAADDEIVSLKSSDVSHGMTTLTEDDTFGIVTKLGATDGGMTIQGFAEGAGQAVRVIGNNATDDTNKDTGATAKIELWGRLKSGTTAGAMAANSNILNIRNNGTTRFIFDADGDSHQDVGTAWTNF